MNLTRAESHVVEHLAADITRRVRPGAGDRCHKLEAKDGEQVGHKVQRRTVRSLEAKGFIGYINGAYYLTLAGLLARDKAKANR